MKKIRLLWFRWWYGEPFEEGYSYLKIESAKPENVVERLFKYYSTQGYEKFSEVKVGFLRQTVYIWIRKPNTTNSFEV